MIVSDTPTSFQHIWTVNRYTYETTTTGRPVEFLVDANDGSVRERSGEITESMVAADLMSMVNQPFPEPFPNVMGYDGAKARYKTFIDATGNVSIAFMETDFTTCLKRPVPLDLQDCCGSHYWKSIPALSALFVAAKTRYSVRNINCIVSNVPGDIACEQINFGGNFILHEIPIPPEPPPNADTQWFRYLDVNCECLAP